MIQSSDQASGVVSFESVDDVTLNEPTSTGSADSLQEIRLIREPGVFGVVNVPFKITTLDGKENITDLAPSSGYITFKDKEVSENFARVS